MDEKKKQRYLAIAEKLTELVGGKKNIQGVAHCATRLRIVLENNDITSGWSSGISRAFVPVKSSSIRIMVGSS